MHNMLSDCITLEMLDAVEQMLVDFHFLLPRLYGKHSSTANAHLLTYLAKYVNLWLIQALVLIIRMSMQL